MPRNSDYWDDHTATTNLPGEERLTAASWPTEIAFYLTPEQDFAYAAMGPLEGRRVVEIGAGVGVNAIHMARQGARVAAVDMSPARLAILRDVAREMGLPNIHPVRARAEALPFRSESIDIAYTKASLIHTELPKALEECRRVLGPAGKGVFVEPTTSNPFVWLYRRFFAPAEWKTITRYFSRAEEKVLKDTFGNLRAGEFFLMAFPAFYWQFGRRHLKRFRRWLRPLHGLDKMLFRIVPPLRRLAWFRVYVVEKVRGGPCASVSVRESQP